MKKRTLGIMTLILGLNCIISAQPFLQLLPRTFYDEKVILTDEDWAGFYRTSQYDKIGPSLMLLIPLGDSMIGFCASEDSRYIRFLEGKKLANSISYNYWQVDLRGKKDTEVGHGIMVMKDDEVRKDVYCKHGDAKGLSEQKGCFSAGKKLGISYSNNNNLTIDDWLNIFRLNEKPSTDKKNKKAVFANMHYNDNAVFGDYTFEYTYSYSSTATYEGLGLSRTRTNRVTIPKSKVQIIGLPYGDRFGYILLHGDGSEIGAGVLTLNSDKQTFEQEEVWGKIKKLGKD
ncbi:MAG: hypothetical protein V1775_15790 [Bacteroidota bacterium]